MYEKYNETIKAMSDVTGDDISVCLDKLIYATKNLGNPNAEEYFVPDGFNYGEFAKDYKELISK